MHRRTAPAVRDGRVAKKNNWTESRALDPSVVEIVRRRPNAGYRHLLTKADVAKFLALLPEWDDLAIGLNQVILGAGDDEAMGWHQPGIVAIEAWEAALWWDDGLPSFIAEHDGLLRRLGVEHRTTRGRIVLEWTEPQARAFQLLHVLLHELGHHHDRMTTRRQRRASRGEGYAEAYARTYGDRIWQDYVSAFGI